MPHDDAARLARRRFLQLGAAGALALSGFPRARAEVNDRKLLFVLGAYGGASILDGFLPVVDYEVGDPALARTLNVFPDGLIEQLPQRTLRSVKLLPSYGIFARPAAAMGTLLQRHGADVVVLPHEVSSVNHAVGQQRSLNGAGIDRGRTIMEAVAARHGAGLPLANVNMGIDGYARHGIDASLPEAARHELITQPPLFALGTHGSRGLPGTPTAAAIERARAVRERLERDSVFGRTFAAEPRRAGYLKLRGGATAQVEAANLVEKLLLMDAASLDPKYGLSANPMLPTLREALPQLAEDRLQQQIALGFLLAFHGASTAVTVGFSTELTVYKSGELVGSPLSFDFAHNQHRVAQNLMWSRTASLLDALITLLKQHDYLGDPALGKMWDRSLIYVATEFGREKQRPPGAEVWGTSHDLNNGSLLISPLLKGDAVYGGVDPRSGLTYGCDPATGVPDKQRSFTEADVYGVIAQALNVPLAGAPSYAGIVRAAATDSPRTR